jgi:hypothetical protein
MSKLQEKPSKKKLNLLTFFYVFGSFLPSWIRIRIQGHHRIRIYSTDFSELSITLRTMHTKNPLPLSTFKNMIDYRMAYYL